MVLMALGCGKLSHPSPEPAPDAATADDVDYCDDGEDWSPTRIADLATFESAPDTVHRVLVSVRPPGDDGLRDCGVDASERFECVDNAETLLERFRRHQTHLDCLMAERGHLFGSDVHRLWWYERLRVSESEGPSPILISFEVSVLGRDVRSLASHPVVSRITLPPATQTSRPIDPECSTERESIDGKFTDVETREGSLFAIVTLRAPVDVPVCEDCVERTHAERGLHVVMNRRSTCVQQWVAELSGEHRLLPHAGAGGTVGADITRSFPVSFAVPITREQARMVASHVYVERVEIADLDIPDADRCPAADLNPGACPTERVSLDGKIEQRVILERAGLHEVSILVRGGAQPCPFDCPGRGAECPDRDAAVAQWTEDNLVAQRCVRAELDSLDASYSAEATWLVNTLTAQLTWPEIEAMATHPHVERLAPTSEAPPPSDI